MSSVRKACILGIKIDNLDKKRITERIFSFLDGEKLHQIATINPEFLLESRKNKVFRDILNNVDLGIADGIGVKFAFWRYGMHLKARYSGIDLMWDILEIADAQNLSVCLVANKEGLSTWQETRNAIQEKYSKLKIKGINIDIETKKLPEIPESQLMFVNFGAPYQEILINSMKNIQNTSLRLGIGVGGSFDYITGKVTRAPKIMRYIGLEWLYRFMKQPHRWQRIFNAIIIFPIIILFTKKCGQKCK